MRESRTYGSVRGARDETRVPTATDRRLPLLARLCRPGRVTARRLLGALPPRVQRGGAAVRDPKRTVGVATRVFASFFVLAENDRTLAFGTSADRASL